MKKKRIQGHNYLRARNQSHQRVMHVVEPLLDVRACAQLILGGAVIDQPLVLCNEKKYIKVKAILLVQYLKFA